MSTLSSCKHLIQFQYGGRPHCLISVKALSFHWDCWRHIINIHRPTHKHTYTHTHTHAYVPSMTHVQYYMEYWSSLFSLVLLTIFLFTCVLKHSWPVLVDPTERFTGLFYLARNLLGGSSHHHTDVSTRFAVAVAKSTLNVCRSRQIWNAQLLFHLEEQQRSQFFGFYPWLGVIL